MNEEHPVPREFAEWIDRSLEGTITPEQWSRLEAEIATNDEACEFYVKYLAVYLGLYHKEGIQAELLDPIGGPDRERTGNGPEIESCRGPSPSNRATEEDQWKIKAREEEIRQRANESFRRFKKEEEQREQERLYKAYLVRRRQYIIGLSSLAALLAILFFTQFAPRPQTQSMAPSIIPQPVIEPVVATVTAVSEARWKNAANITEHTELKPGPLHLIQGYAEITFKSQAKVILEAPAEIYLVDENAARLDKGVMTAHVPEPAHGFSVTSPSVVVTDLGTEFGLTVDQEGVADVHVFTGLVQTQSAVDVNDASVQPPRVLQKDTAMRFYTQAGNAHAIALDRESYAMSWEDVLYKPRLGPGIVYERTMPAFIGTGAFTGDDAMTLFLENTGVLLSETLLVNISKPGIYSTVKGLSSTVSAGQAVDSYLIHWHPLQTQRKTVTIRFPRSIVAVITSAGELATSDTICGNPRTQYPENNPRRGLESSSVATPMDEVIMTDDRRNLEVTLQAGAYDQIRVLIAAVSPGGGLAEHP